MGLVAAKCPNCGANIEVDMNDKAGICKYCGTAFITQEAIVNFNTSIVNNNVITNNINAENVNIISGKEEHFMKLTEDSLECTDWEGVEVNTTKALEINPENIRACLLQGLAIGYSSSCTSTKGIIKLNKAIGAYKKVFLVNDSQMTAQEIKGYLDIFLKLIISLTKLAENSYNPSYIDSSSAYMLWNAYDDCKDAIDIMIQIAEKYKFDEKAKKSYEILLRNKQYLLKAMLEKRTYDTHATGGMIDIKKIEIPDWGDYKNEYDENAEKIKKINPDYHPVEVKHGGCYIATCVYGSYDTSPVWVLRRYRDNNLAKTWYGRSLIKIYYFISPKMVKIFGDKEWFKALFKGPLDRKVKKLMDKGYLDTPYYDQ